MKIDRTSLVQNVRSASAFELRRQLSKVGQPPDRLEWTMTPPTVNAYYSSQFNTINFPAGMLQPPFFDATKDDAVNYGAIGMVIGHEILHGFDDSGRQFDARGTSATGGRPPMPRPTSSGASASWTSTPTMCPSWGRRPTGS